MELFGLVGCIVIIFILYGNRRAKLKEYKSQGSIPMGSVGYMRGKVTKV